MKEEYEFHQVVIEEAHCKHEYQKAMGIKFWEEHLQKMIRIGATLGKSEHAVKQEISYVMVDIYQKLEMFDKAYDYLVEQAMGCSWVYLFTVQNIVGKVIYFSRLQQAVSERLRKKDMPINNVDEFLKIQKWLDEYSK